MSDTTKKIIVEVSEKGTKATDEAVKSLTSSIEDNSGALEENEQEQKAYNKTLGDTIKETKVFGVSINSLTAGFRSSIGVIKNSVGALKTFKVALASTGVGLLVVALGSLVAWMKRTQEGADFLSDTLAVIGETMSVLISTLTKLGGALVKVFRGDFRGAAEQAVGAFKDINGVLAENIKLRRELEAAQRDYDKFSRESLTKVALLEQDIQRQLLITRDVENTTSQERLNALARAQEARRAIIDIQKQEAENVQQIALDEAALAKARGEFTDDNNLAIQEATAARIRVETAGFAQLRELENRINTERAVYNREQVEAAKVRADEALLERQASLMQENEIEVAAAIDLETQLSELRVMSKEETDAKIIALGEKLVKDKKKQADSELAIEEAKNQAIGEGVNQLFGGIAALFGQNSALGKAAAIAQATMNTYQGVTAIIKDELLPTVAKPFFIAAAVAQGLAAVKQIQAVPLPQVQVKTTPFGDGGIIDGNPHERGGVWLNAEGGEYIINKRAMRAAGVRSLVESINSIGQRGGSWAGYQYANGGLVGNNIAQINLESAVSSQRPVLVLEDFSAAANAVRVSDQISSL